jgi:DNA-binding YbaB/EbfC family protein
MALHQQLPHQRGKIMKGGLSGLMKQAQKMKDDFENVQQELANLEVIGQSGGGMVKVTMTGRHDVLRVDIDSALITEEKEMLEDLLASAINDAVRKVESLSQEKLSGLTGGLGLPGGFKLPF